MTTSSVRSSLVNFCPKKKLTSNGSKPIRVLTRTKSSCSDERLTNAKALPDFQQIWRNFFTSLPLFFHNQAWRGSTRKKKSCSYELSSVCAVGWVRAEWIQIPSRWRFVVSFPKSAGRGEVNFRICGGGEDVFESGICVWGGRGQIYKFSLTCRCRSTLGTISSYL